jgi:hypothetical protein
VLQDASRKKSRYFYLAGALNQSLIDMISKNCIFIDCLYVLACARHSFNGCHPPMSLIVILFTRGLKMIWMQAIWPKLYEYWALKKPRTSNVSLSHVCNKLFTRNNLGAYLFQGQPWEEKAQSPESGDIFHSEIGQCLMGDLVEWQVFSFKMNYHISQ